MARLGHHSINDNIYCGLIGSLVTLGEVYSDCWLPVFFREQAGREHHKANHGIFFCLGVHTQVHGVAFGNGFVAYLGAYKLVAIIPEGGMKCAAEYQQLESSWEVLQVAPRAGANSWKIPGELESVALSLEALHIECWDG